MINAQQFIRLSKVSCWWNDQGSKALGSGAKPDQKMPDWVKEKYFSANAVVKNNGLVFQLAKGNEDSDIQYIPFENGKACLSGPMYRGHMISGGFAGCTFQLYHNGMGKVIGAHVYQGLNDHRDFEYEAALAGWELLYSWESNGLINDPTMRKSGFVFVSITPDQLEIVAVKLSGGGKAEEVLALHKIQDWKHYQGGAFGVGGIEAKARVNRTRAHSI